MQNANGSSNTLVISYLTLRKALGILGISLPFILWIGGLIIFDTGLQESISDYYHTGMRDVFVGAIFAIGLFLGSYIGYKNDAIISDNMAGNLASVGAIGLALFPTAPDTNTSSLEEAIGIVHLLFSALFFLFLAYFSYFLFTKTHRSREPTPRKLIRNQVYRACGIVILAAVILIFVYTFLPDSAKQALSGFETVFWLESLAILAFGMSWLIKGEWLLADQASTSNTTEPAP